MRYQVRPQSPLQLVAFLFRQPYGGCDWRPRCTGPAVALALIHALLPCWPPFFSGAASTLQSNGRTPAVS